MTLYETVIRAMKGDLLARSHLIENAVRNGRHTVIAVDFDGTLCISDEPGRLVPNESLFSMISMLREMGYEFILWTCRECGELDEAVDWLDAQGIQFDAVNDNVPSIISIFGGTNSRKIHADEYWDDRAVSVTAKEQICRAK